MEPRRANPLAHPLQNQEFSKHFVRSVKGNSIKATEGSDGFSVEVNMPYLENTLLGDWFYVNDCSSDPIGYTPAQFQLYFGPDFYVNEATDTENGSVDGISVVHYHLNTDDWLNVVSHGDVLPEGTIGDGETRACGKYILHEKPRESYIDSDTVELSWERVAGSVYLHADGFGGDFDARGHFRVEDFDSVRSSLDAVDLIDDALLAGDDIVIEKVTVNNNKYVRIAFDGNSEVNLKELTCFDPAYPLSNEAVKIIGDYANTEHYVIEGHMYEDTDNKLNPFIVIDKKTLLAVDNLDTTGGKEYVLTFGDAGFAWKELIDFACPSS